MMGKAAPLHAMMMMGTDEWRQRERERAADIIRFKPLSRSKLLLRDVVLSWTLSLWEIQRIALLPKKNLCAVLSPSSCCVYICT